MDENEVDQLISSNINSLPAIPKFTLIGFLGKGNFSSVFKADVQGPGFRASAPSVAVKILNDKAMTTFIMDTVTELNNLKVLHLHQDIVRFLGARYCRLNELNCYDKCFCKKNITNPQDLYYPKASAAGAYSEDGQCFKLTRKRVCLVFNLCKETFSRTLQTRKQFQLEEIVKWGMQLCNAVLHLHHNNLIHFDIKPCNLLLTQDGDLKLSDVGACKGIGLHYIDSIVDVKNASHLPTWADASEKDQVSIVKFADAWSIGRFLVQLLTNHLYPLSVQKDYTRRQPERDMLQAICKGGEEVKLCLEDLEKSVASEHGEQNKVGELLKMLEKMQVYSPSHQSATQQPHTYPSRLPPYPSSPQSHPPNLPPPPKLTSSPPPPLAHQQTYDLCYPMRDALSANNASKNKRARTRDMRDVFYEPCRESLRGPYDRQGSESPSGWSSSDESTKSTKSPGVRITIVVREKTPEKQKEMVTKADCLVENLLDYGGLGMIKKEQAHANYKIILKGCLKDVADLNSFENEVKRFIGLWACDPEESYIITGIAKGSIIVELWSSYSTFSKLFDAAKTNTDLAVSCSHSGTFNPAGIHI